MSTPLVVIDRMLHNVDDEIFELPTMFPYTYSERNERIRKTLWVTHDILEGVAVRMSPRYDYAIQAWNVYLRGEGLIIKSNLKPFTVTVNRGIYDT